MTENTTHGNDGQGHGALAGYRVLDFGWVLAGAIPGMVLADMGAEVVKVETRQRLDYMRMGRPIVGDQPDPEQNPMFHNVNRGKLSVTLNISEPDAVALAKRLVEKCDVVIENFSPGVMDRLGLGYETLRAIKPDIIMASISSTGQDGPLRDLRAYAPSIGALSGLDSTMGYEGGGPLGLKHAFGDICGALHAVFAIVSALYHRNRTGEGQYIDVSMLRATVVTQGAGLMEHALTGRALQPRGNYDPTMVPYGNYPCAPSPDGNDDKWLSIAVATESEWQGLVSAMGSPAWAKDQRFGSQYRRQRHRRELDALLSQWTAGHDPDVLTDLLQGHGVAVAPVLSAEERLFHPHFMERGLYRDIDHPALGAEPIFNLMWGLSKTPSAVGRHAPLMGEHNREVLCGTLGLSEAELAKLEERQVVY
ncbi:MAG: CoA transferase [Chloroflexi bacterium]|nr:CoA transferase [Chloroflexota bacterium]